MVRRRTTAQALALRARIVLESATRPTNTVVADELGVTPQTVGKWRTRFIESGVQGLLDEPRVGRPREVGDNTVEQIVVDALQSPPPGEAAHWSTAMAAHVGVSQSTVSRIWRTFGLKPHIEQTWKLSPDPQFLEKVRDIVGAVPRSAGAGGGDRPAGGCQRTGLPGLRSWVAVGGPGRDGRRRVAADG